jgi:hypothetical protein
MESLLETRVIEWLSTKYLTESSDRGYENNSKNIQFRITNRVKALHTKIKKCY